MRSIAARRERRTPLRFPLLLAVVVSVALPCSASASRSDCQRLKGHDLARARSIKLVEQGPPATRRLLSCSLPHGRVRPLASKLLGGFDYEERYTLGPIAGAYLALTESSGDRYASGFSTSVVDLRTGRRRPLASSADDAVGLTEPGSEARSVFVTAGGRAAASVLDRAGGDVRIVALGRRGGLVRLDAAPPASLPADSLALDGSRLTWLHDGLERGATLP